MVSEILDDKHYTRGSGEIFLSHNISATSRENFKISHEKAQNVTATESMCPLIILLLLSNLSSSAHHVMKTICNAFSLHAVMISISLPAICICVTVALAGASQASCQWVLKHVKNRCDKSKYAFDINKKKIASGAEPRVSSSDL